MQNIMQAFQEVKRINFVPERVRSMVGVDMPLSIGYGQTNSQPTTVRLMLEWLHPRPGNKVLDVGSGSGWSTALLAKIVGREGTVYAVERIPELIEFGRRNCHELDITNAEFFKAGHTVGLPDHAPFDRILVSANASGFPEELVDQLKVGGKLVIPVRGVIHEFTKLAKGKHKIKEHPGFAFVPLVE